MRSILDIPFAVFALSRAAMSLSAQLGVFLQHRMLPLKEDARLDLSLVIPATLTLLGLLIGFSFSLATSRYEQRVLFYETRDKPQLERINARTAQLQSELWSVVEEAADKQQRYPILAVSGVNDVLNSQAYTQSAWLYRLPVEAWFFMFAVAIFNTLLIGYSSRRRGATLFVVVTSDGVDRVLPDSRHRESTTWPHSCGSGKSHKPLSIPTRTIG